MARRSWLLITALLFFFFSQAQTNTASPSADEIVQNARKQAEKENKNVLLMFHASWCVWCHKMDSSMNDASCKKFFDDNFVIAHLVVMESADKKNLETPVAMETLTLFNGDKKEIPFWVILDKDGNLIGDCQIRPDGADLKTQGENMGCPTTEEEVNAFIKVLKKTSRITPEQEIAIVKRFRQNDVKK
jgi:thioredoxin-related protein